MKRITTVALFAGCTLLTTTAFAHISLMEPAARYDGSIAGYSKACPCGVGESNRLCNVDGDRSDPDRSNNVTVLEAGSTITVMFDEYIGHTGRYRIAFDPDGADYADFNNNILADWVDPAGMDGNSGMGSIWEMDIVVPDTPCDNCTLQVIQRMDGDTVTPVGETINVSSYYQCADITIVPAGSMPDMGGGGMDMGGPGPVDMGGNNTPGNNTPGNNTPGNNTPGNNTTPINNGIGATPDAGGQMGSDGGIPNIDGSGTCSTASSSPANLLLLLVGLLFVRRRR